MSYINVILVTEAGKKSDRYFQELANLDVVVDRVDRPSEVFEKCSEKEYSGLLLDFATMMKCHGSRKIQLDELGAKFPTIRLNVDPTHDRVVGMSYGQRTSGSDALRLFIDKCKEFKSSKIRSGLRIEKVFSVLVYDKEIDGLQEGILANTTNVSPDGVFITTLHPFTRMDKIWVQIKELDDKAPIQCEVRWVRPWGVEDFLPGAGVLFLEISPEQQKELKYFASKEL